MPGPLKVLIAEDDPAGAEVLLRELVRGGFEPDHRRVENAAEFRKALLESSWDIVICDHAMPSFDSFAALKIVREMVASLPFIVVSGSVGEEIAVEVMKAGANDYLMKDKLIRLAPAVERELREAESRRRHDAAEDAS
ncbi:MAG: response regulator [Proteobacteria bacterium]|nr:response regulator [Pseudomonadota bacterium]